MTECFRRAWKFQEYIIIMYATVWVTSVQFSALPYCESWFPYGRHCSHPAQWLLLALLLLVVLMLVLSLLQLLYWLGRKRRSWTSSSWAGASSWTRVPSAPPSPARSRRQPCAPAPTGRVSVYCCSRCTVLYCIYVYRVKHALVCICINIWYVCLYALVYIYVLVDACNLSVWYYS